MRTLNALFFCSLLAAATLLLPGCPGQQAMQQQVDSIQTANLDLQKRVQNLETQLRTLNTDFAQMKRLLEQMATTIQTQDSILKHFESQPKSSRTQRGPARKR